MNDQHQEYIDKAARVAFVGGPLDGQHANLANTPPVVHATRNSHPIGTYDRIDDPDTGQPLNGYLHRKEPTRD